MSTVTIPGVELMAPGTWDASTGRCTVTPEDLADCVKAYNDLLVDRIPIKIGHDDARFQDAEGNPPETGDGNPAYGWVKNLRISDGGKLVGDYVGVPSKLADAMKTAWPRRSAEMAWGVKSPAGKNYRAILTGVALLGENAPAVKGLNDVLELMAASCVVHKFSAVIQPAALHDTPTIQPPVPESPDGATDITSTITGGPVELSAKLREVLGLADDATEDQIAEACKTYEGASVTPIAPAVPAAPPVPAAEPAPLPVAASAAEPAAETVVITAAQFAALQAGATAGIKAREQQDTERRNGIIRTAMTQGRIHPNDETRFRALLDTNETATTELLASLTPVVPTHMFGSATAPHVASTDEVTDDLVKQAMKELGLKAN